MFAVWGIFVSSEGRIPEGGAGGPCTQHHADGLAILHSRHSCALHGTAEDAVGSHPGVAQVLIQEPGNLQRGLRADEGLRPPRPSSAASRQPKI